MHALSKVLFLLPAVGTPLASQERIDWQARESAVPPVR